MEYVGTHYAHKTDYVTFALDEYRGAEGQQMLLAHLHVHQWSPSSLKRIRHDWALFREAIPVPLFALPMLSTEDPAYPKWERFVTSMGWRPTNQQVLCLDGIERPLFTHTIGK
ncbi:MULTISPECIES: hypothetical protein [unclassified Bradyrhizobium]|uniref:hypothetical protein n=1 Tax=unclassified Bradyrhizobium TaxID=2631580 RepID=UPI002915DB4B|nr:MULTISPECIES: hypothetical protein [unclassified Bradyrhizobium]